MKRATGPPMWPLAPKISTLPADIVITLSPGLPQPGVLAREPHLDAQRAITSALRVREGTVPSITSLTFVAAIRGRSEEHTSELQSLMRISYAVFCLKKKKYTIHISHISGSYSK